MTPITERPAVPRKNFSLALVVTMLPGAGVAAQTVRRGIVQGTGVRRAIGGIMSSAGDPDNFLLVLAILLALAVLVALIILAAREFFLWRRGPGK